MTRFSIPPTPINFTIWYEYHAGRDPALSRAIDGLLAGNAPFTPETTLQLYEEFLNPAHLLRASRETSEKLQKAMDDLRSVVGAAEENARSSGAKLEIGRASCRERVCQDVYIPVGSESLKK